MTLEYIDKARLIFESYRIDGITKGECRSIFLDWAIKLPSDVDPIAAIGILLAEYGPENPSHPMTEILRDGLGATPQTGRRGGRKSRVGDGTLN